jgi:anti-sigma factor RsiW
MKATEGTVTTPQAPEPGMTITCQQVVEVITDYLEDVMDPDLRSEFDSHLTLCPGCAEYLAQMRQTIHALGYVPETSLSPQAQAELLEAFHDLYPNARSRR